MFLRTGFGVESIFNGRNSLPLWCENIHIDFAAVAAPFLAQDVYTSKNVGLIINYFLFLSNLGKSDIMMLVTNP